MKRISNKTHQHNITLYNSVKFNKSRYFHKIHNLKMIQKKIKTIQIVTI